MQEKNFTDDQVGVRELSMEECDQVGGGVIVIGLATGIYMATGTIAGVKLIATAATAAAALAAWWHSANLQTKPVSYPTGGFGSDRRIKQDIRAEGEIADLNLMSYTWEYKSVPGERFVGVMAQDLLAREDLKSSVFTFTDGPFEGFYGVDYAALGLRCLPTEAWDGDVASLVVSETALAG